jgi:hypothetical protein
MALLADGSVITVEDLRARDSSLVEMLSAEGVELSAKIALAQIEIQERLLAFVQNIGPNSTYRLDQIVVTDGLRRWYGCRVLELIYQDVYFSQLNDRYQARWKEYSKRAQEAERDFLANGVGINWQPMRRPAAAALSFSPGGMAAATYYVQTTWTNPEGEESEPSPVTAASNSAFHSLSIAAQGETANASGWHVYAGYSEDSISRQTSSPLALNTPWIKDGGTLNDGPAAGSGQRPDVFLVQSRVLRRG